MKLAWIAAAAMSIVAVPASAAPTITFAAGGGSNAPGTTIFQDFDSLAVGSSIGNFAYVYDTSSSKGAYPAFGGAGNYASVLGGGTYSVSFDAANIFSFVIGSLDRYNQLTVLFSNGSSQVYNGGEIIGGGNYPAGDQTATGSNGLVTIFANGGPGITGAIFRSDTNSFEFDNLAVTSVPEATTWATMILGFGAVGGLLRRRKAKGASAVA